MREDGSIILALGLELVSCEYPGLRNQTTRMCLSGSGSGSGSALVSSQENRALKILTSSLHKI